MVAAEKEMPAGAHLWHDFYNNRFMVFYKGSAMSRSWPVRGVAPALKDLLRFAWAEAAKYGEPCPITNLFSSSDVS